MQYINGTSDYILKLESTPIPNIKCYIDASHGVYNDRKSITGVILSIGSGTFYAQSSKQKIVTKSSTEAELVAISDGLGYAIWARNFLLYQGYPTGPIQLYEDNMSTITLAEKGWSSSGRTRHVDIRYYWIKEKIDTKEVKISHMPTEDMLADIMTKTMPTATFKKFAVRILNN
jgi:hypothetical protein